MMKFHTTKFPELKSVARGIVFGSGVLAVASLSACEAISALAYTANGPAAIKAKYVPPAKDDMLVLVESYTGGSNHISDAANVNVTLQKDLKDNKVAPLIDESALNKLRDSNLDGFNRMTVDQIGRAVGAKQVLYVNIVSMDLDSPVGSHAVRGHMEARVRMIDPQTGQTRWPDSEAGELLKADTPWVRDDSENVELQVSHDVADKMATQIGDLFHDWTPEHELQEKTEASGLSK